MIVLFVTVCLVNDDMVLLVLLKVMIDLSGDDDEILCGELVQIIIIISVRCSALLRTATERTGDVWGPP